MRDCSCEKQHLKILAYFPSYFCIFVWVSGGGVCGDGDVIVVVAAVGVVLLLGHCFFAVVFAVVAVLLD